MAQPDQIFDAGDQHQVDTKAKRLKVVTQTADQEFAAMMDVPAFRAFMWKLLERTHVYEASADVTNPNQTYFREGERNIGLGLMADVLRLAGDKYPLMAAEAAKRKEDLDG